MRYEDYIKNRIVTVEPGCVSFSLSACSKAFRSSGLKMAGTAMLCFGVWRGEAATVLSKAIKLCLECVGIG